MTERGREYEWGETDCVSLIRIGLAIVYGKDVLSGLPDWTTLKGAVSAFRKVGDVAIFLQQSGAHIVHPTMARNGDLLVWDGEDEDGLPQTGLIVPKRKVITSAPDVGVVIARPNEDARIYSWEVR